MHHLASDDVFVSNGWIISVPKMDLYKLRWHPLFCFPKFALSSSKITLKRVREIQMRCRIYGAG